MIMAKVMNTRTIPRLSVALLLLAAIPSAAQSVRTLSLDDALQLAAGASEEVTIARAGVTRASGNQEIARSQFLPQIYASAGYTRTLKSQYSALASSGGSGSDSGSSSGLGSLAKNLPFGQANQWSLGLTLSQTIFAGGRLVAQQEAADARRRSAEIDVTSASAQLMLNVTQAYYDAVLADQLVTIADSSLAQTEEILRQTDLAYQLGAKSEFEMLRARVSRDNQIPVLMQRRLDRSTSYDRLKQLLNVPFTDSLALTSGVGEQLATFTTPADTSAEVRAPVRQAAENVRASQAQIDIASSERWPQVSLNSRFAPVAYPENIFPSFDDFRTDWTVGLSVSVPLFTGGRIGGNELVARGTLDEAQGRLQQAREAAALEARAAMNDMAQSEASVNATSSTVEQASRAYQIAEVRYREGLSTQVELADARLLLEQARANRARSVRNLQVARVRLSLLRDLPLGAGVSSASAAAAAAAQSQQGSQMTSASQQQGGGASTQGAQPGGGAQAIPGNVAP